MSMKAICLCMALLALTAGFVALCPRLGDTVVPKADVSVKREADALEKFRRERSASRETQLKELLSIMTNADVDEDIRRDAGKMRLEIISNMEKETVVEGALISRGFEDAVCTAREGSVNVLVRAATLTQAQSSVIMELASRETGQPFSNIKIIPVS